MTRYEKMQIILLVGWLISLAAMSVAYALHSTVAGDLTYAIAMLFIGMVLRGVIDSATSAAAGDDGVTSMSAICLHKFFVVTVERRSSIKYDAANKANETGLVRSFRNYAVGVEHHWVTKRMGGAPDIADSYELVRYCDVCGEEASDE